MNIRDIREVKAGNGKEAEMDREKLEEE